MLKTLMWYHNFWCGLFILVSNVVRIDGLSHPGLWNIQLWKPAEAQHCHSSDWSPSCCVPWRAHGWSRPVWQTKFVGGSQCEQRPWTSRYSHFTQVTWLCPVALSSTLFHGVNLLCSFVIFSLLLQIDLQ